MTRLPPPEDWMTAEEVAQKLHVHVQTVRQDLRAGRIKGACKYRGKYWRVSPTSVTRYQQSMERA